MRKSLQQPMRFRRISIANIVRQYPQFEVKVT